MGVLRLKDYQEKAVSELLEYSDTLINSDDIDKSILLKSITGSGKTVMSSEYISRMCTKYNDICFIWLCVGKGALDVQSYNSLKSNVVGANILDASGVQSKITLEPKDVVVLSWESINRTTKDENGVIVYTNVLMREGEKDSLIEKLENTRSNGTKVILMIDESHHTASSKTSKEIIKLINPVFTVEITATPKKDRYNSKTKYVEVNTKDVIEEGVVKKAVYVNKDMEGDNSRTIVEDLLVNALNKHKELSDLYEGTVNPLILIQLPDKDRGNELKDIVLSILSSQGIKGEEVGIWLSDKKINVDGISNLRSKVKCLLFKQAIATGWDCPRSQILVKLRDSSSETFDLQVIGRVLRMPELKHYDNDVLNYAYIYTNIAKLTIDANDYSDVVLPKMVGVRDEFQSKSYDNFIDNLFLVCDVKEVEKKPKPLLSDIESILAQVIKDMDINISDLVYKDKLYVDLGVGTINTNNIEDVVCDSSEITDSNITRELVFEDIHNQYMSYMSKTCGSFASVLNVALSNLYTKCGAFDYMDASVLQYSNKFNSILKHTIHNYNNSIKLKTDIGVGIYRPEHCRYYNDKVEFITDYKKSYYTLVPKSKYSTERFFEEYLEGIDNVLYWIKNNDSGKDGFSIAYTYEGNIHLFYPDYIVRFKDGSVGIFETKSVSDRDGKTITPIKREVLSKYIDKHNANGWDFKLKGCVVIVGDGFIENQAKVSKCIK